MRIVSFSAGSPEIWEGMTVLGFMACLLACVVGRHGRDEPCDRLCDVQFTSDHTRRHTAHRSSLLVEHHNPKTEEVST
jgi:hypothetical protein